MSYNIQKEIFNDKKYKFKHKCATKEGSSGSPILTLKNKVIGVHRGAEKALNLGTFLNEPISDFIKLYYNKDGDKNIIGDKINEIFLKEINEKFNLNITNINIYKKFKFIEKYLGNDGYKELQELFLYYNSKIASYSLHLDINFHLYYNSKIASYSLHLDINFHKRIIKQMENNICLIIPENGDRANGFFCKIPFPDKDHMLEVLMTNNHVINEDMLYKKDENLIIKINNKKFLELNLNNRIKYTSKENDITIIEIKPKYDKIHNFLELDDKILNDIINNEIKEYEYSSIYQIFYSREEQLLLVSYGMIRYLDEVKFMFRYLSLIEEGASGSPILDLNNKVIGIYTGTPMSGKFNRGQFLNYPIKEFIQKNYYKNSNLKEISKKEKENDNFSLIKKYLGQDIFIKLNKLYLSFKIEFPLYNNTFNGPLFNLKACKLIINQMEKGICIIKEGNREAVGFPCKIPFPNEDNLLKVFITNNSILNEDILNKKNENILINLNGETKSINLSNRRKYSSKEYNTTIIELKDDDVIQEYLDIDDHIISDKDFPFIYLKKEIYMIKNELGILTTTYSYIERIEQNENKEYNFFFKINKKKEPLEGPIFTNNCKLIGLRNHYEKFCFRNIPICGGTFLNYPIKEFIKKFYNVKINNNL